MASLSSSARLSCSPISFPTTSRTVFVPKPKPSLAPNLIAFISKGASLNVQWRHAASNTCEEESVRVDRSLASVRESLSDEELHAAVRLRMRTFHKFNPSCGVEDYKRYLIEKEYEALKERLAGKRIQFERVSCINAILSSDSLQAFSELCSSCKIPRDFRASKRTTHTLTVRLFCGTRRAVDAGVRAFFNDGKDFIVVGTMCVNQCHRLEDELTGKKPEGIGAGIRRGYLSNVCVAKELHRNGLGNALVTKSKDIARHWGISDLYVHVAADNEAAQRLYEKAGFAYEDEEPAWRARFLGRGQRLLLWADLSQAG